MIEELRYWPKDEAIPDGWELVNVKPRLLEQKGIAA